MNKIFGRLAVFGSLAALAVTAVGTASVASPRPASDLVTIQSGPVQGVITSGYRTFQGIPYAAPPVGDLRWASPRPPAPWTEPLDATRPGAPCSQPLDQPISIPGGTQDCLTLNVTTPAASRKRLPVLVWIHGGSFTYGDGASYDAHRLATQGNLVVVTLNYRLGAFGFMAHPTVAGSGNYGLEDQQAALRWVRQNASAFGGDSDNVTVMGQSGGGYSVCAHLTMPSSAGLFDRAIIQSAGCSNPNSVMSREAAQKSGIDFANQLGCTDPATTLACMREADEDKVLAAAEVGHDGYRPIVGGLLPRRPADAIAQGRFHKVPLLFGVNHDEESGRVAGPELYTGVPLDEAGYVQMVRDEFKTNADAVLAEYPVADYATPSEAATAAITDGNWSTYVRQTQLLLAKHVRVFAYDFTEKQSPWFAGFNQPKWTMGTGHMVEMAYLFDLKLFAPLTDHQRQLSTDVIGYWASFAHDGDPNHKGAPKWRPFNKNEYTQAIATGPEGMCSTDFAADHRYRFWSSLNR